MSNLNGELDAALNRVRQYVVASNIRGTSVNPRIVFLGYESERSELLNETLNRVTEDRIYKRRGIVFALRDVSWLRMFNRNMGNSEVGKRTDYEGIVMID